MIRLRRSLERGLRHPVLGPLLLVLLAVLLAFMVLHETSESIAGEIGELCVGITLVLLTAVVAPPVKRCVRFVRMARATRAPPRPPERQFATVPARPDLVPLRL